MKKIGFVISVLASAFAIGASAADYELTPLVGVVWPEGNLDLITEGTVGGEFQINNIYETIKPEIAVLISPDAAYTIEGRKTIISRLLLNGVHEYDAIGSAVLFMKAGIGYENLNIDRFGNTDSVMADAGAGFKFPLLKNVALKLEAIYMLKYNDARWDNNLAGMGGVTFAFGGSESAPVDKKTGAVAVVTDSDGDGVADAEDKCPGTPDGFKVDKNGCPLEKTIRVTFESGSKTIAASSRAEVAAFATFLKESPAYSVEIVGHTDSTGSAQGNMALSKARAESVKALLVDNGVDANRIVTIGKGESEPIAGNDTAEGRAMNRRIEVILHQ